MSQQVAPARARHEEVLAIPARTIREEVPTTPTRRRPGAASRARSTQEPIEVPDSPDDSLAISTMDIATIRSMEGTTVVTVVANAEDPNRPLRVHSLGPAVDAFVDHAGYTVDFVERLYSTRKHARNAAEFEEQVQRRFRVSAMEAEWLWSTIVYPAYPKYRERDVIVEVRLNE